LTDGAISEDHYDGTIFLGQIKSQHGQIHGFLHRSRSQDDTAIIAMATTMHHLVIVSLGGGDIAQTGATAHHIHQHNREFGTGDVRDSFSHQADAGT